MGELECEGAHCSLPNGVTCVGGIPPEDRNTCVLPAVQPRVFRPAVRVTLNTAAKGDYLLVDFPPNLDSHVLQAHAHMAVHMSDPMQAADESRPVHSKLGWTQKFFCAKRRIFFYRSGQKWLKCLV